MISNISQNKLKGRKIGVYFGTFAPLHIGHQQQIYKCSALNDSMLIVVSGTVDDRGAEIGLPLEKRFRYLREAFNDEAAIAIAMLDESDLPPMPTGWDEWTNRLLQMIEHHTENSRLEVTFYVGEEDYVTALKKRFPVADGNHYAVEVADRSDIQISATEIRQNPQQHWNDINRVFRRHFSKVVTIMGAVSTGRSTLVRRLARSINAPFSLEYAQEYEEKSNISDTELQMDDFVRLITGQYDANSREINSPANQGIVFLDTDAVVLRVYAKLYLSEKEFLELEPLFQKTIADEHMDLILVIPPIEGDVNNEVYTMGQAADRFLFHQELMRQLEELGLMNKVVVLADKGHQADKKGYLSRYHQAIDAIKEYTSVEIQKLEY